MAGTSELDIFLASTHMMLNLKSFSTKKNTPKNQTKNPHKPKKPTQTKKPPNKPKNLPKTQTPIKTQTNQALHPFFPFSCLLH